MSGYPRRGKLTDTQVVKIRLEYARGYKSCNQLAPEYGLNAATISSIVQGSFYKAAGGLITWPGQRLLPEGEVRGYCWDVACRNPIATSGWAQRMHMCERCFRLNGGKKGRSREGKERTSRCPICKTQFTFYRPPSAAPQRTCSSECGRILSAKKRQKRPIDLTTDRLYELYWGQSLTTREIAVKYARAFSCDSVRLWLIQANISRRRANWRPFTSCMVEGCGEPIKKLFNGVVGYGRFCASHLNARALERARIYASEMQEQRALDLTKEIGAYLVGLPNDVRVEAQQEIVLASLSGELALPLSRESVKPYIARAFRENANAWKFLSLAAPMSTDEGAQTWGERLGLS